ncbi:silent information regulator protein Sir2p [Mycena vulgaris]|nr:silent information regulator protein Sir2p [Mycena vulgaris]
MASDGTNPRPQLPPNFATDLWQSYATQQKRKLAAASESTSPSPPSISPEDRTYFAEALHSSTRILALLGAGLSAPSGLPTFRAAGGFWRDPALVWQFYSYRRHCALRAAPNEAHRALAELARARPGFLAMSQNVDGLCQRASHPPENIQPVHGSLFSTRCTQCPFVEHDNFADPLVPALAQPEDVDPADATFPLTQIPVADLPHCPECGGLLRPDVVWFGESLPAGVLERVEDWMRGGDGDAPPKIDLMLVVGTSALVYPAAGYIHAARARGARIAVFSMEELAEEGPASRVNLKEGDWFFKGDAAVLLPELLKGVIGSVPEE